MSRYVKMLTSWRAHFAGGLEITGTEMKFSALDHWEWNLIMLEELGEEADLSQAVHIIRLSKSKDNGLKKSDEIICTFSPSKLYAYVFLISKCMIKTNLFSYI